MASRQTHIHELLALMKIRHAYWTFDYMLYMNDG